MTKRKLGEPAPAECGREVGDRPAGGGARAHHQQYRHPSQDRAGGLSVPLPVEGAVEEAGEPAHRTHRVRQPARVADQRVEGEREKQDERRRRADGPVGRGEEEHRHTMESAGTAVNGRNGGGR